MPSLARIAIEGVSDGGYCPDPTRPDRRPTAHVSSLPSLGFKPADPGPLGLAAFAMTTFVLSMFNSNLVSSKGVPVVLGLALAYGGIVQLLAGMWEFRTGNTFGAVAFSSFGAFWISFWALNVFYAKDITGNVGHALGLYLWAWAIFTAYMTVAALRVSGAVLLVFVLLTVTFVLLAIGATGADETVTALGRLPRPRHRRRRLVRVVRRRRELDVRADRAAGDPAQRRPACGRHRGVECAPMSADDRASRPAARTSTESSRACSTSSASRRPRRSASRRC